MHPCLPAAAAVPLRCDERCEADGAGPACVCLAHNNPEDSFFPPKPTLLVRSADRQERVKTDASHACLTKRD